MSVSEARKAGKAARLACLLRFQLDPAGSSLRCNFHFRQCRNLHAFWIALRAAVAKKILRLTVHL